MILVAYRHGLRVSELVDLRWDQIDFDHATLHVRRAKKARQRRIRSSAMKCGRCAGYSASRIRSRRSCSPRERGAPFSTAGFARLVERAGEAAGLGFKAHPHMLRHAVASRWPTQGTIPGPCRPISATRTFSTR